MQEQRPPPPAYVQHAPETLSLPSVPTHAPSERLPGIRALDLRASAELSPRALPALRESSVSMDDPDVRLAAEALSGLGNPDFARSPPATSPVAAPQPMLSLLTSNHPWLGGTISGSLAAYNLTKDYSPRFVRYGAELVERNVGSPVVNTVSSVGRRTGMEQNLRRYLGEHHRRPSDLERGEAEDDAPRKRARAASPASDMMDVDTLPAYDTHRSPRYEETPEPKESRPVPWPTQLIMTTSGLGVALSAASLRSLKQCLHLLRGATSHIDAVMRALKLLLAEYEAALRRRSSHSSTHSSTHTASSTEKGTQSEDTEDPDVVAIAQKIKSLSNDIWTTLHRVVQAVSRHTGGALPQNASQVVRTQLLSVPQRWALASRRAAPDEESNPAGAGVRGAEGDGEAIRAAKRMLAFAIEGLDMMGQITAVVDGTVGSAECWLARIGRAPESEDGEKSAESANGEQTEAEKR